MKDVDLVIEAVLEDMKIKQDIWKKLEGICRPDVIFATNTSALPITEMASILKDPGRMIGLHFFNPAHRMQLLEIICAQKTSDQTLATSVAFGRGIRKIPIVVNDGPGFYVSRQLGGLMGGSVFLVADGVDGADDRGGHDGLRHAHGAGHAGGPDRHRHQLPRQQNLRKAAGRALYASTR